MAALEIVPKIGCKNMCSYCPQETLIKAYNGNTLMTLDQFEIILMHTPKNVRIDFSGFGEAFLNPSASRMMVTAMEDKRAVLLYTTLVGFTKEDIKILKGYEFDGVVFHEYEKVLTSDKLKKEFEEKKELFQANIKAKGFKSMILEPQWRWSRGGNVWDVEPQKGKFHCLQAGKGFDRNVVIPNGDLYICCMDFGLKHKIGNLYTTRFNDINRQPLTDLSNMEDSDIVCRKCELYRPDK